MKNQNVREDFVSKFQRKVKPQNTIICGTCKEPSGYKNSDLAKFTIIEDKILYCQTKGCGAQVVKLIAKKKETVEDVRNQIKGYK